VILGLESYLSAEMHLKILDEVKSPSLNVYYDCKNAKDAGHDPVREIAMLGKEAICQIHFKDEPYLDDSNAKVDWPGVVDALHQIRYSGWAVIESGCPSQDVVADARRNLAHLKQLFGVK
jgi:sugar phosphate isomerase/epimerase